MAPGALALDAPTVSTTQSHGGDVCIHQPRPDAHQVPCMVAVTFGDDTEACLALNTAYIVVDDCTTVPGT
jgi:hypothetical protein